MAEYLPETRTENRTLGPNAAIDLAFRVPNAGQIEIRGTTVAQRPSRRRNRAGDVIVEEPEDLRHRVDLFQPGITSAVATRTSTSGATFMTFEAPVNAAGTQQEWVARMTNLSGSLQSFRLSVSYPGSIELATAAMPLALVNLGLNTDLARTRIVITRGTDASYVEFSDAERKSFTVPDFVYDRWWTPEIRAYPSDIRSSRVGGAIVDRNGHVYLGIEIEFEEEGREITGDVGIELYDMKLNVETFLNVAPRRIAYADSDVKATFAFGSNVVGVPDWLVNLVINNGYKSLLRRKVEQAAADVFRGDTVQEKISSGLTEALLAELQRRGAQNPQLVRLRIQGDSLLVTYYNS